MKQQNKNTLQTRILKSNIVDSINDSAMYRKILDSIEACCIQTKHTYYKKEVILRKFSINIVSLVCTSQEPGYVLSFPNAQILIRKAIPGLPSPLGTKFHVSKEENFVSFPLK